MHVQCIIHTYNHMLHTCMHVIVHVQCTHHGKFPFRLLFYHRVLLCYCLFSVCGFHVINFEVSHIKGSDIILSFYTFFSLFSEIMEDQYKLY